MSAQEPGQDAAEAIQSCGKALISLGCLVMLLPVLAVMLVFVWAVLFG